MVRNDHLQLGRKRCHNSDCREMINVHTDADQEDYIKVVYREATAPREEIYYHVDCAPFGATTIPEELGLDA